MTYTDIYSSFDSFVETSIERIGTSLQEYLTIFSDILEIILYGVKNSLLFPHPLIFILALGLIAWRIVGINRALLFSAGFLLCSVTNLWEETIATTSLTIVSASVAILIAIPLGILSALNNVADKISRPVMDFMQTMPSYVYLLPAVAFLGFGESTAISTTTIFAIPPALKLTNLGIRQVPVAQLEAGRAFGASPTQLLLKVQMPMAMPTIMAGVNQTLMLALAMSVIAGIVGGGGLGAMVYKTIMFLQIGKAFNAGLAIVIIAIVIDRLSEGMVEVLQKTRRET
jgi:ABC-type proline/glycine betaine transport system permease subunit